MIDKATYEYIRTLKKNLKDNSITVKHGFYN